MTKMTNEEVFRVVYTGLRKQGFERSLDSRGDYCMYRGLNGKKCAVGMLIPDDRYDSRFEKRSYLSLRTEPGGVGFDVKDVEFLNILQAIHDTSDEPGRMRMRLLDVAYMNDIDTSQYTVEDTIGN